MSAYTDLHDWYVALPGNRFRIVRPIKWEVGRKGSDLWVIVPIGTVFDVSVPVWLRWAFDPRDARYLKAAALHDWTLEEGWDGVTAAGLFAEALKADGVGFARRLAMVLAVIVWTFR
ncbi:MAG: DUF1353 domain-containing protein [Pseudomonadota bacterium]